jgi:hypothetical protein
MSMPPDPVTGFCILPRLGDDLEDLVADGDAPSPARCFSLELPEGGGVEVEGLDVDAHLVGPHLAGGRPGGAPPAAGQRPAAGSRTRCTPTGDDGVVG